MKLTIHRGTREIGGNCIELQSRGRRIFFDLGIPLVGPGGGRSSFGGGNSPSGRELLDTGILPRISGVYQWDTLDESVEGIVISHAHLDHYGFACHLHQGIRRYMGEGTRRLIEITGLFSGESLNAENHATFSAGRPFHAGPFEITPFLMDHSAFDSYAFVIKDGERGSSIRRLQNRRRKPERSRCFFTVHREAMCSSWRTPAGGSQAEKRARSGEGNPIHSKGRRTSSSSCSLLRTSTGSSLLQGRTKPGEFCRRPYTAYILSRLKDLPASPSILSFQEYPGFHPCPVQALDRIAGEISWMFRRFRINPEVV